MTYPFHPPKHPAELLSLRVKDIDFGSNNIFVRAGEGKKDRTTKKGRQAKERSYKGFRTTACYAESVA